MTSLRDESRVNYRVRGERASTDELRTGALQRIADATEAMAKHHTELIRERDMYARLYDEQCDRAGKLERSNAALRGQITRLRKKLAAAMKPGSAE